MSTIRMVFLGVAIAVVSCWKRPPTQLPEEGQAIPSATPRPMPPAEPTIAVVTTDHEVVLLGDGDERYDDLVLVDRRRPAVVKTVSTVEVGSHVEWAPRGTKILVAGTVHDATRPTWKRDVRADACWVRRALDSR